MSIGAAFDFKTRVAGFLICLCYHQWYSVLILPLSSQGYLIFVYSQYIARYGPGKSHEAILLEYIYWPSSTSITAISSLRYLNLRHSMSTDQRETSYGSFRNSFPTSPFSRRIAVISAFSSSHRSGSSTQRSIAISGFIDAIFRQRSIISEPASSVVAALRYFRRRWRRWSD